MNHLHSDKICLMKTSAKHVDSSCVQGESVILKGEYHWKTVPSVGHITCSHWAIHILSEGVER